MNDDERANVWVLGAGSGIGRAAAAEFANVGARVVVSARRANELERFKRELGDRGEFVETAPCNVASRKNVEQTAKKFFGEEGLDCLVNAAGVTAFKTIEKTSVPEIEEILTVNLFGAIYAIKAALPLMIDRGGGTIVNILSVAAKKILVQSGAYSASKAGLHAFSKVLREETRKQNIRVVDILPGATDTPIWSDDMRERYADRMMRPEDVARVIVGAFLQKGNMVTEEITLRPEQGDL
jgi:short-subunit dehydrogenase